MRTPIVRTAAVALFGFALGTLGCSPRSDRASDVGSVGVALQVAPGISLDTVSYSITGPGAFARMGTLDTSNSSTVSGVVGGLPAGTGFSVALAATAANGATQCAGSSAPFAVMAHATTAVTVHVTCKEAATTGSVLVNGTLNVCPLVDGVSASPAEVFVGSTIALAAVAHDSDTGPSALTYHWTTTGGTLSDASAQSPTLTCTVGGPVTVTVAVSDGDCGDTLSTNVTCTGVPHIVINEIESNNDPVGDWVELTNSGTATADISGWKLKDDMDSHPFAVVPAGTSLAPGGFFAIYVFDSFGLGAADLIRLFDPAGNLADSYSWTTHANGTYGRCPDGTGAFVDMTPSRGAANVCVAGSDGGAGSAGGADGGAGGSGGTSAPPTGTIVINEVESNSDPVGDWVELTNTGTATADISGWKLKDDTDSHPFADVPAGTSLAPGGFYAIYVFDSFGLGAADLIRLFDPAGNLVDSYSWTTHANGTYGRCPDGTGAFVDMTPSRGTANICGGGAAGAGGGTAGSGGAGGTGGGTAGSGGTAGAGGGTAGAAGTGSSIVVNEVESNGDAVGDWVELTNTSAATVDISGWKLKDNDDTHAFVVVPSGTTLAPGGFFAIYVFQTFGLGAPDMARLYDPSGNLVDSYSWTAHATGTYGRCPDGTGPFIDSTPTRGAANACSGGGTAGAGGAGGAGGTGGAGGLAGNELAWPGTDTVITVDDTGAFASNLSGLSYQPATATDPAVLWGIQNGPSKLYRLLWNSTTSTWESDPLNGWSAGKTIHYATGLGDPDSEGVSKAEFADSAIYVSTERDNDNNSVNRFSVLRYDANAAGTDLTATNDWELTADLPAMGINLGLEAITYIPDTALVAAGFFDESKAAAYDPASYPNHGTGLFFVGLESNGVIYGYALDHADNTFTRVATFPSGQVSIMDLSYDREVGYLWAQCDNTCDDKATVFRIDTTPMSPTLGRFQAGRIFDRPASLPASNFEGIGIAPEAECVGGQKHFFWSDDSALDMHSIRRGSIPCGAFF